MDWCVCVHIQRVARVCFLLKQNFQNYRSLAVCIVSTVLLEYQTWLAFNGGRILRAPSLLCRIAWQRVFSSRNIIANIYERLSCGTKLYIDSSARTIALYQGCAHE